MKKILCLFLTVYACEILAQSGQKWATNGNSASSGDFVGTTNNVPLVFKTNNASGMVLSTNGVLKINSLTGTGTRFLQSDAVGNLISFPMGNPSDVLFGNGTWGSLPPGATSWQMVGNNLISVVTGNIGIGTTNPQYKLDVVGDVNISNNLYVGGGIVITDHVKAAESVTTTVLKADSIKMDASRAIYGSTRIEGDVDAKNKLSVTGNATFNGNLKVSTLAGTADRIVYVDAGGNLKIGPGNTPPGVNGPCVPGSLPWYEGGNTNVADNTIGTCDAVDFILKTNNTSRIWVKNDGKVGFNTSSPVFDFDFRKTSGNLSAFFWATDPTVNQVEIKMWNAGGLYAMGVANGGGPNNGYIGRFMFSGTKPIISYNGDNVCIGNNTIYDPIASTVRFHVKSDVTGQQIETTHNFDYGYNTALFVNRDKTKAIGIFNTSGTLTEVFKVYGTGETHIGYKTQTTGPHTDAMLTVYGKIVSTSCYIRVADWADYVFNPNYKLPNLYEIEKYYKANKHLEGIPSEKEVLEKGVEVAEMNKLLLKKVEELTILMVQQQKEIDALKEKTK